MTVYISVFDVMAVQCGTVTVLYCVTFYISVFDVMAVQCGTVTVLYSVTVYISVFDVSLCYVQQCCVYGRNRQTG